MRSLRILTQLTSRLSHAASTSLIASSSSGGSNAPIIRDQGLALGRLASSCIHHALSCSTAQEEQASGQRHDSNGHHGRPCSLHGPWHLTHTSYHGVPSHLSTGSQIRHASTSATSTTTTSPGLLEKVLCAWSFNRYASSNTQQGRGPMAV